MVFNVKNNQEKKHFLFGNRKKKRGNLFMLESENGEAVRIDEYGNKEYMVKGSGGSKWIDKQTGEIRE